MKRFFAIVTMLAAGLVLGGCVTSSRPTAVVAAPSPAYAGAVVSEEPVLDARVRPTHTELSANRVHPPHARRGAPRCQPGSVFIREVNGCVQHVTDQREIGRVMPPNLSHDPNCVGKPIGHRYDKPVTGPQGQRGVAHIVCGTRGHGY